MFLLDTNFLSEALRPQPDARAMAWMTQAREEHLFISVVTLAELHFGVERLPIGARRDRLGRWLAEELAPRFETRTFPVDPETARIWGNVTARGRAAGRPISVIDGFIAATAQQHDLIVVTRNVGDFTVLDVRLINPWAGS
jgi:toxin FitB